MSNQVNSRLVFANAVRAMRKAGVNPAQAILSQSYLRLEVVASTAKTQYQFGVLINDQPGGQQVRPTEYRLNLQDCFFVSSVALYTCATTNATDTNMKLDTFPNAAIYTTAGVPAAMYNLYNGYLSLSVNNRTIVTAWQTYSHYYVPQTQQTATNNLLDQFEMQAHEVACEPNWVLIGSKNNQLTLNLPSAVGTLQASKTTTFVLILKGVLAQNVTVVS